MSELVEITINKVSIAVREDPDAGVFVGYSPRFDMRQAGFVWLVRDGEKLEVMSSEQAKAAGLC